LKKEKSSEKHQKELRAKITELEENPKKQMREFDDVE